MLNSVLVNCWILVCRRFYATQKLIVPFWYISIDIWCFWFFWIFYFLEHLWIKKCSLDQKSWTFNIWFSVSYSCNLKTTNINIILKDEVPTPDTYRTAESLSTFLFITIFRFELIINCLSLLILYQVASKCK